MEENKAIKWHPAFYGAIEYELKDDRKYLQFESEHQLSKEPLKMDMLIIKKPARVKLRKPIGWIFGEHNIVEYKSPTDGLTIDTLYKTVGYATIYKALGKSVDEIKCESMSISIFRNAYPRDLLKRVSEMGATVENPYDGIYYIKGIINIPLQIIVTRMLNPEEYPALRVLCENASEDDVRRFITQATGLELQIDKQNTDAVFQASVAANFDLYEKIRRESNMCEALRELMKDEIEKEVAKAANGSKLDTLYSLVHDGLLDITEAAKRAGVTEEKFKNGMNEIYK